MERILLTIDEHDGVPVARLAGELDKLAVEQARAHLDPLAVAGKLVIDLDEVTFVDSAGLHALFGLAKLATSRGSGIALAVPESCPTARVIALVHLAEVLPVRDTVEAAASALQVSLADTRG